MDDLERITLYYGSQIYDGNQVDWTTGDITAPQRESLRR